MDQPDRTIGAADGSPTTRPVGPWERVVLTVLLLGVVAVWGWTFALMKDAIDEYGVASFLAVRFIIGALVLAPFTAAVLRRRGARLDETRSESLCGANPALAGPYRAGRGRGLRLGAAIGVVLAVSYLLQTYGLDNTTATNTGLITGLFIVFTPLANRALFGVRTSLVVWIAIAVSVLGLVLLTGVWRELIDKGVEGESINVGDVLVLGAAACFGLHIALLDRYAKGRNPIVLAQGQIVSAGAIFLAVWPFVDPIAWPSAKVWLALVVTGVLATAIGFLVQTMVQRRLSAVQTAAIIITEPIFAAIFGYLLANDRLSLVQILGAVLMFGALLATEFGPRRFRNGA